jgi:hypothetical protein
MEGKFDMADVLSVIIKDQFKSKEEGFGFKLNFGEEL